MHPQAIPFCSLAQTECDAYAAATKAAVDCLDIETTVSAALPALHLRISFPGSGPAALARDGIVRTASRRPQLLLMVQ
jgi:hypothetical protein